MNSTKVMGPVVQTPRAIRVVVDLIVDEDRWEDAVEEGATDKFLVGEVRKTLHVEASGPYYDVEVQEVKILEEGGHNGQSKS